MRPPLLQPLLLFVALLLAVAAQASERKTDVVTLYNGDRITGEIKSLDNGILQVSTDALGTVQIEWPEVAGISSKYRYELRLSDGQRFYGSLPADAVSGQLELVDATGRHALESLQVVEIRPIEDNLFKRLDVYFSTTFAYTKASDVGQVTLNTDNRYEDERSITTFTGRTDLTRTGDDHTSATRLDLKRAKWNESRSNSFRLVFSNFESNDELKLNSRIGVGAGVGRFFIDTHSAKLTGATGLQVITEDDKGAGTHQDLELFIASEFATWKFTTPEMDVNLDLNLYPSITDPGRLRTNSSLRIRWELIEDLYWDVTAWSTTDNDNPAGSSTDYAITTGIGWSN